MSIDGDKIYWGITSELIGTFNRTLVPFIGSLLTVKVNASP